MPAYVTMLRLLVSPDPITNAAMAGGADNAFLRDHSVKVMKKELSAPMKVTSVEVIWITYLTPTFPYYYFF